MCIRNRYHWTPNYCPSCCVFFPSLSEVQNVLSPSLIISSVMERCDDKNFEIFASAQGFLFWFCILKIEVMICIAFHPLGIKGSRFKYCTGSTVRNQS